MRQTRPVSRPSTSDKRSKKNVPLLNGEFRLYNGARTLFINGKPKPAVLCDVHEETTATQITTAVENGISLFRVRRVALGWEGINKLDYKKLTARIQSIVNTSEDCVFILEVVVDAPSWWLRDHESEASGFCLSPSLTSAGSVRREKVRLSERSEPSEAANGDTPSETFYASWASKRWLNDTGEALIKLAQFVTKGEWAQKCIGYQVACGEDGRWQHAEAARLPDVGLRMTDRFRNFCVEKYRRNTGLLRKGWDDPRADFDRIKCPDAYERRYADLGMLRDPLRSRRMMDYFECYYGAQNEAALYFCDLLKKVTQNRALVGLAYAAPFGRNIIAEGGQGLPEAVFDSPDVDFFVDAPLQGSNVYASAFSGSLALREKFLFHQSNPVQTVLNDTVLFEAAVASSQLAGLIVPVTTGKDDLVKIIKLNERGLNAPSNLNKRTAQIAVIADAMGPTYLGGKDELKSEWNNSFFVEQMGEISKLGATCDLYLLSDLFHPKFHDYKVYIFLNTLYLSEAERRRIDARVKRSNQIVIWLWGPGILSETGVDEEAAQKLIGLKLRVEKKETSMRVRVVEGNDALTWGFHVGTTFGPERAVIPTLTVGDKTAIQLGANTDNKTVFGVRREEEWTSIHFGVLPVPATLLRNAARAGGVHLYADTALTEEQVVANGRLIAITSKKGGVSQLSLPAPHEIQEIRTDLHKEKLEAGSDVSLKLAAGETRYLEIRPIPRKREDTRREEAKG